MAQLLNNLLSSIDPTTAPKSPVPGARQTQAAAAPKAAPRPAGPSNGTSQAQPLKRKADGPPNGGQNKIQRRDGAAELVRPNGIARPAPTSDVAKVKPSAPANLIPYRGTAATSGLATTKPSNTVVKKPGTAGSTPVAVSKPAAPTLKPAGITNAAPVSAKKGSYAAMLQRAKEAQQTKPAAPPVKHEPTKILTKKERLALKAEASAAAKGKKPALNTRISQAKVKDAKGDVKEKGKPAELGYQGTARPKKPVEIGYKGTAKPSVSTGAPAGKAGRVAPAKAKPKPGQGRYDGYADWSDLEEMEDEEEEDYDSEGSSDMEGGIWDVEQEEQLALKAAKVEDAEELARENAHKREKEERRRRLEAMSKAAAAKRRY